MNTQAPSLMTSNHQISKIQIPQQHFGIIGPDERPVGVFLDMPENKYFQVKAFSYSYSKEFAKSPAHGQAYLQKEHRIDPDREFFKAVHYLTLEGNDSSHISIVDGTWSAKIKADVIAPLKAQGKLVLKQDDYDTALKVSASLKANQKVKALIDCCMPEVSIFWTDHATGVYCKARLDMVGVYNGDMVLADLKSFSDLHNEKLMTYQVLNQSYQNQMAFYSMAINAIWQKFPKHLRWIFCEDKAPYANKVRTCPEQLLNEGWATMTKLLSSYKSCQEFDSWPGFEEEEKELELPRSNQPVEDFR